jgi:hypothetical protein
MYGCVESPRKWQDMIVADLILLLRLSSGKNN